MSWSWFPFNFTLPSFQNLTPPLSIQQRFTSFLLKRCLGHLLKPGQLDISQIEAQFGNGYVEVKDLELNDTAINSFLTEAPVQLRSGSIGSVTVRVPWTNLLSGNISLSISALKLEACICDKSILPEGDGYAHELSQSVASVAETFLHDELSRPEELELRNSVHEGLNIPGGSDSFSRPPGSLIQFEHGSTIPVAADPEGISIFAGLLERLLVRFEFHAAALQVTLVNPNNSSFTLSAERVAYGASSASVMQAKENETSKEIRSVEISGLKITFKDLEERSYIPPSNVSPLSKVPVEPLPRSISESSDSEIDEDTQMMMSQSLVSLPPRPISFDVRPSSPALSTISSAASSLYQSATSASAIPSRPGTPLDRPDSSSTAKLPEDYEHTIFTVSDPITFRLTTPPAYVPSGPSEAGPCAQPGLNNVDRQAVTRFELDASIGIIAVALHARNVGAILQMLDSLMETRATATQPGIKPPRIRRNTSTANHLECSLHCKGIVGLVLGSPRDAEPQDGKDPHIAQFFQRPLTQPYLPRGCVRVHLDTIKATAALPQTPSIPSSSDETNLPSSSMAISLGVSDLSVLAFHANSCSSASSPNSKRNLSSPVLIIDPNLPHSYFIPQLSNAQHQHQTALNDHRHPYSEEEKSVPLPLFDVIDWTKEKERSHGTSLRPWRAKGHSLFSHRSLSGGLGPGFVSKVGLSTSPTRSSKSFLTGSPPQPRTTSSTAQSEPRYSRTTAIDIAVSIDGNATCVVSRTEPLHAFLDLCTVESLLVFMEDALPKSVPSSAPTELPSPVYAERSDFTRTKYVAEGNQFAKAVSDDLKLEMEYKNYTDFDVTEMPKSRVKQQKRSNDLIPAAEKSSARFDLHVPLLRVEVRVACPKNRQPRSGSLVVDVRHMDVMLGSVSDRLSRQRTVRIAGEDDVSGFEDWINDENGEARIAVGLRRAVVAYAPLQETKAQTVLSLGPLRGSTKTSFGEDAMLEPPLILLRSIDAARNSQKGASALVVQLPSVHVNVDKALLDGLQIWADDVSQWSERTFGHDAKSSKTSTNTSPTTTRNPSLIGSRYFVQRTGSGATQSDLASTLNPKDRNQEFTVKAGISEAFIRLIIPVVTPVPTGTSRFVDAAVSGLDALIEVKPEGKDETVISLNLRDANAQQAYRDSVHTLLASNMNINRRSSVVKVRFHSAVLPGTTAKESQINLSLHGLRVDLLSELEWMSDLLSFVKNPPGTFESVIPNERTSISGHIMECAFRLTPCSHSSSLVLSFGDVEASTDLVGESPETSLRAYVGRMSVLLNGDFENPHQCGPSGYFETDAESWMKAGYALLVTLDDLDLQVKRNVSITSLDTRVSVCGMKLCVHLCADSIAGIARFASDIQSELPDEISKPKKRPTTVSNLESSNVLRSLDDSAFRRPPIIGPLPDMIEDDLPTNPEYLDASFGAAAGLRPIEDEDDDFYPEDLSPAQDPDYIVSRHGGETIKVFCSTINYVEHFYDALTPSSVDYASEYGETWAKVRAENCDIYLLLYDGYDWEPTRRTIREEVKRVRRRLAKIGQLLANGQTYDPNVDEINSVLFNSVYVGLDQEAEDYERNALMAAIDDELHSNTELASESSWQSFSPGIPPKSEKHEKTILRGKKLERSKTPSIEFSLSKVALEFDQYRPGADLASRLLFTIKDLEILDHIRTSTWSKFLTGMRSDSRGNVRETDSNMVRVELQMLLPYKGREEQEARLKAKLLPLRLHVDQDALDFLKKFFSFTDPDATPSAPAEDEIFFQHVEIFPVDLKLDYKPRRVDYRALKEGRTIELMNFFHFDGAEMTLRHLTLKGITGWPRMFETLNDLWTPDVKANQLAEVISGVSPIRSAVNVGSGVADLILLPIAQYKKDGRIIRGLQKGATAFVKSTAIEAIKLGARLATGTQVVLEQAENVLGSHYKDTITAEAVSIAPGSSTFGDEEPGDEDSDGGDLISKYAEQPTNIKEGVRSAYRSLSQNIKSAGQTILAVPMEVYEKSGKEGPTRAVIRAVPIAVLKPLIGASEAVSKTLLGIHGTLNPEAQLDTAVKYKHR